MAAHYGTDQTVLMIEGLTWTSWRRRSIIWTSP